MSTAILLSAVCAALDSAARLSLVESHQRLLQVGHFRWFVCERAPTDVACPLSLYCLLASLAAVPEAWSSSEPCQLGMGRATLFCLISGPWLL